MYSNSIKITDQHRTVDENATDTNKNTFIKSYIVGYWVEDGSRRGNMESFMSVIGLKSSLSRQYVRSPNWEDEKVIFVEGDELIVNEVSGPTATHIDFKIKLDNETVSELDIDTLQMSTNATAEMTNTSLILYIHKPGASDLLFTITYRIDLDDLNTLNVEHKHLKSKIVWRTAFRRQQRQ